MSLALGRVWRAPAVQALVLQCAAFPLTLVCVYFFARAGLAPGYAAVALIQGVFASLLTWWRKLAPWWLAIELLFPLALLQGQLLAISPRVFLAGFLFLLALYWSTFRTQVPYYPSGRRVWDEVARLLPLERPLRVIDIGSGLGGLVLELAKRRPHAQCEGIELAPLPWLVSRLRAKMANSGARFLRGDYEQLNFAHYDAVFAYLSPAAMSALYKKAAREMRSGAILLSYEFLITERAPDLDIVPTGRGPSLYVWHF
ncbi:SAM-dependent methyltransferase [Massilia sp. TSP1-1-2]|uniref:SAM-dependent methyltransferase n=1 Tax=unclassified Massilia TaxID=2609279 RepID=UPI003CE9E912